MNTQLQRKKRQRGSQTIEGGLVCLILFGLILLVLDLSLSIFIKSTLTTRRGMVCVSPLPVSSYPATHI